MIRKALQRKFFSGPQFKDKAKRDSWVNPYGFPKSFNCNLARHLYETHIRYVEPMTTEELNEEMKIIGHSDKTSLAHYSELFKGMQEGPAS